MQLDFPMNNKDASRFSDKDAIRFSDKTQQKILQICQQNARFAGKVQQDLLAKMQYLS